MVNLINLYRELINENEEIESERKIKDVNITIKIIADITNSSDIFTDESLAIEKSTVKILIDI